MSETVKSKGNVVDLSQYLNVYKFSTELPGTGEKVDFRPINTFQLKELMSFDGDPDDALDNLINACVTTEGFDVRRLSLQDRFFLLVELRRKSKGDKYALSYTCDNCHGQVLDSIDMGKLKVKKLTKLDNVVKLDNNISLQMKLLTREIRLQAAKKVEELIASGEYSEKDKIMDEIIMSYLMCVTAIVTPAGKIDNPEIDKVVFLFKNGPLSFYDSLGKWFDDLDFGIEFKTTINCTHCKHKETIDIPLENFFS